ncbi:MAG TPA: LodA/GoxA family CTQ-dependent oxidase [Blastocatellia bacterium]|nr:LodA/GoxA family CTQ-dependent oxidase [Blastocatellia bacterium]
MAMTFKIHPAIGIARVGDSTSDFYIAPEDPGALPIDCDQNGNAKVDESGREVPISSFKDGQQRIKRQAARFRVYVYDDGSKEGRELKTGDEIQVVTPHTGQTMVGEVTDVRWTVYLANKKASWYAFSELQGEHGYAPDHPLRNPEVTEPYQRQMLIIDPGPRQVLYGDKKSRVAQFARGQNPGGVESFPPPLNPFPINTLGEVMATRQDKHNRLLVLGGYGRSGSYKTGFADPIIREYANNDGWFDDTSDGPVTAQVSFKIKTIDNVKQPPGRTGSVAVDVPAWVIVGYPRYAPQILDIVTMDDTVYDVAVRYFARNIFMFGVAPFDGSQVPPNVNDPDELARWRAEATYNPDYYPYFWRDIWPILERPNNYQWVMANDPMFGGDPHNTGKGGNLDVNRASVPPYHGEDPEEQSYNRSMRMFVYHVLRKPGMENSLTVPPDPRYPNTKWVAMPFLCGDNPLTNTLPSKFLRLTDTQLFILKQWAEGKFINEKSEDIQTGAVEAATPPPEPPEFVEKTGVELDRGVLSNLLGGAFCPGGEACWIMRNPAIYSNSYRINQSTTYTPGQLSLPGNLSSNTESYNASDLATGLEPGDITKYSAVPWQSDFNECSEQPIDVTYEEWCVIYPSSTGDPAQSIIKTTYWWPSHRPMQVYVEVPGPPGSQPNYSVINWSQGIPQTNAGDLKMVSAWTELGFVRDNADYTLSNGAPQYVSVEGSNE